MSDNNENEEHSLLEQVWISIGPQGMVAAAVATAAIGSATGWVNAAYTVMAGLAGAMLWMIGMKLLLMGRPNGYRRDARRR